MATTEQILVLMKVGDTIKKTVMLFDFNEQPISREMNGELVEIREGALTNYVIEFDREQFVGTADHGMYGKKKRVTMVFTEL